MEKGGYIYLMTNKPRGTFYVGVTADLVRRIYQHKNGDGSEFVKKHCLSRLVWFDHANDIETAILMEKRIKRWHRQWKIELVEKLNPMWSDLYPTISREWT